jgi:N-acetylmuramoyl-L-alanine amidase
LSAYSLPLTNRRPRCQPLLLFAPVWRCSSCTISLGHDAEILVPEFEDIPLSERVRRVNAWCRRLGKDHVVLISVHVDAAGSDGQWHTSTGWSCFTSPGQTAGDRLADCLYRAAEKHLQGHKIRTDYSDGDPDKEAGFYILNRTKCPAALVEVGSWTTGNRCSF